MKYEKKFLKLVESELKKYTPPQSGSGYYVNFIDGILNDKWMKDVAPVDVVKNIEALIDNKCRLRVTEIDTIENIDASKGYQDLPGRMVTVVGELAPGRYYNDLTVQIPIHLVELIDDMYPNSAPIPDHWKHKSRVNIKPVEVGSDEDEEHLNYPHRQTRTSDHGDGQDSPTDSELNKESYDPTSEYLDFLP